MTDIATAPAAPIPLEAGIVPGAQRATIIPSAVSSHGQVLASAALSGLALGNNHLTFHGWRTSGGPMAFPLLANPDGSNLTGMGPDVQAATVIEYVILAGTIISLINTAIGDITTSKNSSASPVGQRFADVYTIPALSASLFIAADVGGGVIQWFQVKNA